MSNIEVSFLQNAYNKTRDEQRIDWDDLVLRFRRVHHGQPGTNDQTEKLKSPAFVPASFYDDAPKDQVKQHLVKEVTLFVQDLDGIPVHKYNEMVEGLKAYGFKFFTYTTW